MRDATVRTSEHGPCPNKPRGGLHVRGATPRLSCTCFACTAERCPRVKTGVPRPAADLVMRLGYRKPGLAEVRELVVVKLAEAAEPVAIAVPRWEEDEAMTSAAAAQSSAYALA